MKFKSKHTRLIKITIGFLVLFVAIQFYRPERNISTVPGGQMFEKSFKPEAKVSALLRSSCYDCHSNSTRYPGTPMFSPWAGSWQIVLKMAKINLILTNCLHMVPGRLTPKLRRLFIRFRSKKCH